VLTAFLLLRCDSPLSIRIEVFQLGYLVVRGWTVCYRRGKACLDTSSYSCLSFRFVILTLLFLLYRIGGGQLDSWGKGAISGPLFQKINNRARYCKISKCCSAADSTQIHYSSFCFVKQDYGLRGLTWCKPLIFLIDLNTSRTRLI
jgi:hypothetical protein